jgi:L-ascorbate metabolism protein UlaG (beta-lactamase superfamily)
VRGWACAASRAASAAGVKRQETRDKGRGRMIKPILVGDAFLADVAAATAEAERLQDLLASHLGPELAGFLAQSQKHRMHLWWLGQSGFLIQWNGRHLLLDPYLSDSLTTKYSTTDRPHLRMTERLIEPDRLTFIDVVACTHNHTDHFDPDTLRPLLAANPSLILIVPEANRLISAERLGVPPERLIGINEEQTVETAGFRLTAIPAAHETIERDERGRLRFVGYIIDCGPRAIYHAGDTLVYDALAERLARERIDVALLPINGREPARGVPGNMNGREAAALARQILARVAIPCHYEMFEFNTASPDEFVAECQRLARSFASCTAVSVTADSAIHPSPLAPHLDAEPA